VRAEIHDDVCQKGFDAELGCFVQAYGTKELDASLLLIAAIGFLPPTDPRVRATVEAVERHLLIDGLVHRYRTAGADDGLPPGEGVFLACSFWMVSCLWLIGRKADAQALFERLLKLRNDVGLLAEEWDTVNNRMVGNFPQALSHISFVHAAFTISGAWKPDRGGPNAT
jgi:GH15 family glucan-1,4-alpha-glucosidase